MQIHLVGGAVRDYLLGREVKDRDYVIVGASESDIKKMLDEGFKQVGKDFPVYLHPVTGDEYALARKERKVGSGHHGFDFDVEGVSLEEDLMRRDLTINAMAMDEDGNIIDPYNGQEDLENKILRPVSKAFKEDPVRVLRAWRFLARLGPEWKLDESISQYFFDMLNKGEYENISEERIMMEVMKALSEPHAELFFNRPEQSLLLGVSMDFRNKDSMRKRLHALAQNSYMIYRFEHFKADNDTLKKMNLSYMYQRVKSYEDRHLFNMSVFQNNAEYVLNDLSELLEGEPMDDHAHLWRMRKGIEEASKLKFEDFNDGSHPKEVGLRLEAERMKIALKYL